MTQGFNIDYKLLPPRLQMQLWVLGLDANTSKVNIAYKVGRFRTSLVYNYGGNAQASLSIRRFSTTFNFNPTGKVDVDLGLVFRGFKFGISAGWKLKTFGVGISYGSSLLPFPKELSDVFNSSAGGLQSMAKSIHAAPNNPLSWYKLHSNDVTAIRNAVHMGQQIANHGYSNRFGAGLNINYTKQTGLTIFGGAQMIF